MTDPAKTARIPPRRRVIPPMTVRYISIYIHAGAQVGLAPNPNPNPNPNPSPNPNPNQARKLVLRKGNEKEAQIVKLYDRLDRFKVITY